jgi:microcystin degradation protein MlrC
LKSQLRKIHKRPSESFEKPTDKQDNQLAMATSTAQGRIALGAILTECNELGGMPIDLDWFERYELHRGPQILTLNDGVVGGMLQVLTAADLEPVPLLYASTCPGGPLRSSCYRALKDELLERLEAALPLDGVLLPLHGAACADDVGDLEGDLLAAVRQRVGPQVPIVATLDLHAHVTAAMVQHADALVAWETYPHSDAFSTGQRGARLLADTVQGRCRPTMAMAKVPVVTGAINGTTQGEGPFADLMRQTKSHEGNNGVLSASVFLVHPYLDQPDMGSGGLVITDNNLQAAETIARQIALDYWSRRAELEPQLWLPEEAVRQGLAIDGGPVLLVETADCCGGGAAGDSVASLKALLAQSSQSPALVPVVDAEAARLCHNLGAGSQIKTLLGHRHDPQWGTPLEIEGEIVRLLDGRFTYAGGMWDGVEGNMGPSAVLRLGAIQVLVSSHPTYDWADEQFRAAGLDPLAAKFIVAKNPMNYRNVYGKTARGIFILETPGPTPATVRQVDFKKLRRPYFPRDMDIDGIEPLILR